MTRGSEPYTEQRMTWLTKLGYKPTKVSANPSSLSTTRFQTRDSDKHGTVQQYLASIRAGAVFPRPIITEDGVVITGKRTTRAYTMLRGHNSVEMPAIVLKGTYFDGATPAEIHQFYLMDYGTNSENGERMSPEEIRAGLPHAIALGVSVKQMVLDFGMPTNWINTEVAKIKAGDRLSALGMDLPELTDRQVKALGQVGKLNDGPFRALAGLAAAANLSSNEISTLAADAARQTSDKAGTDVIDEAAITTYAARIANTTVRGTRHKTHLPWEHVSMWLAGVGKYTGREADVLVSQPLNDDVFRAAARERIGKALGVLTNLYDQVR